MVDKLKKLGSVKIPTKDKLFNVGYGVGASIVIIGVLFKLMYWQGANIMLTVGLVTEALVFFMSAFEKPLKTYEWDKIIDFESGKLDLHIDPRSFIPLHHHLSDMPTQQLPSATPPVHSQAPHFGVTNIEGLSDEDAQNSIWAFTWTRTASQLNGNCYLLFKRRNWLKHTSFFRKHCEIRSKSGGFI